MTTKKKLLSLEKSEHELESNPEYKEIQRRIDELEGDLENSVDDFDAVLETYKRINRGPGLSKH